jgi:hypothetical protein
VAGAGATVESPGLSWEPTLSLRLDVAGERLRDDLAVSHDLRVSRHLVDVVGCFGGPQRVRKVASIDWSCIENAVPGWPNS